MDEKPETITADEARALIEQDKQQRVQAFLAYIEEGQRRFRCRLGTTPGLTPDGRVVAQVTVTAE